MKLVFSSRFEVDFSENVEFLAREAGEALASRWENAVYRTINLLMKQPQMGRLRRDLKPDGIRTFGVTKFPRFLIFYTIKHKELILLRLKHGAMNLQVLFSGG